MSDPEPHGLHDLTSAHLADKAAFGDAGAFAVLVERHRIPVWATAALATGDGPTATDVTGRAFVRTLAAVAAGVHDPAVPIDRALVGVSLEMALDARAPDTPSGVELPAAVAAAPPAHRVAGWLRAHEGWPAEHVEALLATATTDRSGDAPAPDADIDRAATTADLAPPPDLASAVAHAWQEWQGVDLGIPERHPWAVALARLDVPLGRIGDALGRAGTRASEGVASRRSRRGATPAPDLPPAPDLLPLGADDRGAEPVDDTDADAARDADAGRRTAPLAAPSRGDRIRHLGAAPAGSPAAAVGAPATATPPTASAVVPPSAAPTADEHPVPAVRPDPVAAAGDATGADSEVIGGGDADDAEVHAEALLGPRSDGLDLPERWRRPPSLVVAGTTPTRTRVIAAVAAGILTAGAVGSLLAAPTPTAPAAQADEVAAGAPTPTGEGALLDDADLVPAAAVTPDGEPGARPDPSAPAGTDERPGGGTPDRADRRGATTDPSTGRPDTGTGSAGTGGGGSGDAPTAAAGGAPGGGSAGGADGGGGTPSAPSAPSAPAPPTSEGPAPTTAPAPAPTPTTTPAPPPTTEPPPPPTTAPAPPTTQPRPVCGLLPVLCPGGGLIP